jgi:hypothetical protein
MRKLYIVMLFIFCIQNIYCQNFIIEYNYSYGMYSLNELKKLQTELLAFASPYNLKQVENFPNYFYSSIIIDYKISNAYIGINSSFMTTGARNDLKDYSGEVKQDIVLSGYKVGVNYRRILSSENKLEFYILIKGGLIISNLKITESINLSQNDTSLNTSIKFTSLIPFVEPEAGIRYYIQKRFALNLNLGYEIDYKNKLKYKNSDNDLYLYHPNGKYVYLDWSGLRSSVGFSFLF